MDMEKHVHRPEEMNDFAADLVARVERQGGGATVIALSGELGAGKTTFAQAAARSLGVEETVNSPTFVIEKIYALSNQKWQRLVHIDAYRLKSAAELHAIGWGDIVADTSNLVIIEWPENVTDAIPHGAYAVRIDIVDDEERSITYGN